MKKNYSEIKFSFFCNVKFKFNVRIKYVLPVFVNIYKEKRKFIEGRNINDSVSLALEAINHIDMKNFLK